MATTMGFNSIGHILLTLLPVRSQFRPDLAPPPAAPARPSSVVGGQPPPQGWTISPREYEKSVSSDK